MSTLYLDLQMGAAGDMLTAALLELLPPEEQDIFVSHLNSVGVPGVVVSRELSSRCGIAGSHMKVLIHGQEEGAEHHHHEHHHEHDHDHHHHEHEHEHHHHHSHTGMDEIEQIITHLNVSGKIKRDVMEIYKLIAEAESKAHGTPVSEIHFHEVGMKDAIMDVLSVAMLMDRLSPGRVMASPVTVGSGTVHCAHGIMPVPAPATANLLSGIPIKSGEIQSELCTPTGAAIVRYYCQSFGPMPEMRLTSVGYGLGTKDFPGASNCVRAMLGEESAGTKDSVFILSCNVDDMTGEEAGFALEKIFEAGARDAFYESVMCKKSRPGFKLTAITDDGHRRAVIDAIFKNTTTLGIREHIEDRYILDRTEYEEDTPVGMIRRKECRGYGVERSKWEYEDLVRVAAEQGISLLELKKLI